MIFLKTKNIHTCETVNMTRKYLPTLKLDKDLKLGEFSLITIIISLLSFKKLCFTLTFIIT